MNDFDKELEYAQKATESIRAKLRLLWGILRLLEERGWREGESNPITWLEKTLLTVEKSKEDKEWHLRETEALDALNRIRSGIQSLSAVVSRVDEDRIMFEAKHHLDDAQELLRTINNNIKYIYEMRLGLDKIDKV